MVLSDPQLTAIAFKVETGDPDQIDYRFSNTKTVAGMALIAGVLAVSMSLLVLEHWLGLIDRNGNPMEISIPAFFVCGVISLCAAILTPKLDGGVLLDRRRRVLRRWRGPFQRRYPREFPLEGFRSLEISRFLHKGGSKRPSPFIVFRLEITGQRNLKLFETEGEMQIRKLADEFSTFLQLPVADKTSLELGPAVPP